MTHIPRAIPVVELVVPKIQTLDSELSRPLDVGDEPETARSSGLSCRLDLSAARAHDAALAILGAYKLTGNFHINLEIVLKDIGAFDAVTPDIEPETPLPFHSDCRHVVFRARADVLLDRFAEITRSITDRIGFDATLPWWGRLFH